jgi:hypothetical protein
MRLLGNSYDSYSELLSLSVLWVLFGALSRLTLEFPRRRLVWTLAAALPLAVLNFAPWHYFEAEHKEALVPVFIIAPAVGGGMIATAFLRCAEAIVRRLAVHRGRGP